MQNLRKQSSPIFGPLIKEPKRPTTDSLHVTRHMGANLNRAICAIITQKHAELAHYHPWEHPLVKSPVFIF